MAAVSEKKIGDLVVFSFRIHPLNSGNSLVRQIEELLLKEKEWQDLGVELKEPSA